MVKEIKAYDSWVEYSEFVRAGGEIVGRHALPSELNDLSAELYRAAVSDRRVGGFLRGAVSITIDDIMLCDCERLAARIEQPHGLWYHWNATPEKGSASFVKHGQEIDISWWHIEFESNPKVLRVEVRVKNPTLETFLAIDPEMRRKMRFQSTSGSYVDVRSTSI